MTDLPRPRLERVEYEGSRWYRFAGETDPANYFASVTNVLSVATHKRLQSWKENVEPETQKSVKEDAADLGTFLHELIEKDLRGEKITDTDLTFQDKSLGDFYGRWKKLCKDNEIHADLVEHPVYSTLGFAGTLDIVGSFKGKRVIMDLKTGRYGIKSGWQMQAYAQALKEMTGEEVGLVGLSVPWNKPMKTLIYEHQSWCWKCFLGAFQAWKGMYWNDLNKMKWKYLKEELF